MLLSVICKWEGRVSGVSRTAGAGEKGRQPLQLGFIITLVK